MHYPEFGDRLTTGMERERAKEERQKKGEREGEMKREREER